MNRYKIGYLYSTHFSFDKNGKHFEGDSGHAVIHTLDDSGRIVKTYDYKVCGDLYELLKPGMTCSRLLFDGFGKIADTEE